MLATEEQSMQTFAPSTLYSRRRGLKEFSLTAARRPFPSPMVHASIAAISLVVFGCAGQGYKMRSVTYEYTDETRLAAERQASQAAQDECYFAGDVYAQLAGPPQIVRDSGTAGEHFRATQFFYCVGARGEG